MPELIKKYHKLIDQLKGNIEKAKGLTLQNISSIQHLDYMIRQ